jgi:hypothetical protein
MPHCHLPTDRLPSPLSAVVAALICACLLALAPAAAGAATWSTLRLPGEAADVTLFGMSCPSAQLCVAVGGNNTIASSTDPAGGASKWRVVYPGQGAESMAANYRQVRGVSCPSPQLCVAVTFGGQIYTSNDPTGSAAAWSAADLDPDGPNTHLYGISCPTADFCAASAGGAKVITSTAPTGGASAWTETQLEGPLELRGISCPFAALCVTVGDDGNNIRPEPGDRGVILSSTDPLGDAWQPARPPIQGNAYGVACPSAALCVSGDLMGNLLVSTDPSSPTSWRSTDGGGSVQITDVDCPSPTLCAAVDNNADVLTSTAPTGGAGAWTFTNIAPYPGPGEALQANGTFGVSCPSAALCAIAANEGQIFTSTDPFASDASDPATAGAGGKKTRHRKRPKRPRVRLAHGPPPGVEISGGKAHVLFRFYPRRRVQVRGFLCRMDDHPLRRCRSPKYYRVSYGRHVFRVRAIGWTGLRGPVERWGFRVCHPVAYGGQCVSHQPPSSGA